MQLVVILERKVFMEYEPAGNAAAILEIGTTSSSVLLLGR